VVKVKITVTEINVQTGEEIFYERDETLEEKNLRLQLKAKAESAQVAEATKEQAKAAAEGKLAALGLTTDDLRALGL
jgi:hypothetical protein